jgi:hypothetical protein
LFPLPHQLGPPLASLSLTLVKGELGVNLGGNSTGDDLEELLTETDEESVHGVLGLLFLVTTYQLCWWQVASGKRGICERKDLPSLLFTELDGLGDESLVVGELGSGEAGCQFIVI